MVSGVVTLKVLSILNISSKSPVEIIARIGPVPSVISIDPPASRGIGWRILNFLDGSFLSVTETNHDHPNDLARYLVKPGMWGISVDLKASWRKILGRS